MKKKLLIIILGVVLFLKFAIPVLAVETVIYELLGKPVLEISNVMLVETYTPYETVMLGEVTTHYTTVYYTSAPATVTILDDAWSSSASNDLGSNFYEITETDSFGNATALVGVLPTIGEQIYSSGYSFYVPAGSAYILDEGSYGTQTINRFVNADGDIAYGMYWVYFVVGNSAISPPPQSPQVTADSDALPEIYAYDDGKTNELKMYPDAYGAGVIGFFVDANREEAVTIALTLEGTDAVAFTLSSYEPFEIKSQGMVLSDDARQLSVVARGSAHFFISLDLVQHDPDSSVMDYPFSVVFSFEGVELNRYDNSKEALQDKLFMAILANMLIMVAVTTITHLMIAQIG